MIDSETELAFQELLNSTKLLSGLRLADEMCIKSVAHIITPHLEAVTESFYAQLSTIPQAANFLEGRIETLKPIHLNWLKNLFNHNIDVEFVKMMYKTGDTHVRVHLPIEFMVGAMTLINNDLIKIAFKIFNKNPELCFRVVRAINAMTGFSLNLMLYSFHTLTVADKTEE
jgi:hypothetical protein